MSQAAPAPEPGTPLAKAESVPSTPASSTSQGRLSSLGMMGGLLFAAVIAAVPAWLAIDQWGSAFRVPATLTAGLASTIPPDRLAEINAAAAKAEQKNSILRVGLYGMAVAAAMGFAVGDLRSTSRAAVIGLGAGLLLGALFGTVGGGVANLLAVNLKDSESLDETNRTILVHVSGWAIAGIGVGLATALAAGRLKALGESLLAGIAGGAIGGAMFVPFAAIIFPNCDSEVPFPSGSIYRLLWIALPAVMTALVLRFSNVATRPTPPTVAE